MSRPHPAGRLSLSNSTGGSGSRCTPTVGICLGEDLFNHAPVNVRQAPVNAIVADRQALMVDPKAMQQRRVNVIAIRRLLGVGRLVGPLVALAVRHASL